MLLAILGTAGLSVFLHWGLGWEATVLAGVAAGVGAPRRGWFVGAAGGSLGWTVLVVYTAAVAAPSLRVLIDTLEALAGNIPGETVVGLTVLLGGVLGALGGGIGTLLRPWLAGPRPEAASP
jgi:hypothetical protein